MTSNTTSTTTVNAAHNAAAEDADVDDLPTILLLGDSLTQLAFEGWGAHLANVYQRRADVANRGCSGYTTEFYKRLPLPPLCNRNKKKVCLVTIFFGANDATLPDLNPHHYVSLEDYARNLTELVAAVRTAYHRPSILLITPPPLDHAQRLQYQIQRFGTEGATGVLERTTENTMRYAQACRRVAQAERVPCVDLMRQMLNDRADGDVSRFFTTACTFRRRGTPLSVRRWCRPLSITFLPWP